MSVTMADVDQPLSRQQVRSLAVMPLWLAFVGAGLEVLALYFEKRARPLMPLSEDFIWMAPLALFAVTLVAIAPFGLLGRVWRPRLSLALALFISSSAVFLDLLMLVPGLSHYGAALLAAGLGVQTTRAALRHPAGVRRLMRQSTVGLIGCFVVAGGLIWASPRRASGKRVAQASASRRSPNVLLITLDTVRAANLSLYGYRRPTTPAIDRFAERGVVFEEAFTTAPWTFPSHASIFTGRWAHELSSDYMSPLDDQYPTLAEYLGDRGYATAGFAANLKYVGANTGLDRGFQHYEDFPRSLGQLASSSTLVSNLLNNFTLRRLIQNDQHLNRVTAEDLNRRVMAWLSTEAGSPFFIFLNYFDAHDPYLPPPPFDRQFGPGRQRGRYSPLHHWLWDRAVAHSNMGETERREEVDAYDGALAYLDRQVGGLLDELQRRGVLDNTLVVITADHGEEFGEHGVYEHGYSLYRAGLHVPLIVVFPGRVPAARRISTPVSLRDLATTLVEMLEVHQGAPFPGTSLARLWRGDRRGSMPERDAVNSVLSEVSPSADQPDWFPSSKGDMKAVVHQGVRYIRNGDGSEEMYDVSEDPWERQNLVSMPEREPALVEGRAVLERLMSDTGGRSTPSGPTIARPSRSRPTDGASP